MNNTFLCFFGGGGQLGNDKNACDFSDGGYGRRYGRGKYEIEAKFQSNILYGSKKLTHVFYTSFSFPNNFQVVTEVIPTVVDMAAMDVM